ncbi:unnamed protein product, partial [Urochloa humidicola]
APRTLTRGLKDPAASTLSAVAPPPWGDFPPFLRCAPEKRGEEEKERKEEKKGRKEEEAATKGRRMPPHPGASPFPALRPRRRRPLSPLKRKESGRSPPPTLGTATSSSSLPIASSYSDIEPAQHLAAALRRVEQPLRRLATASARLSFSSPADSRKIRRTKTTSTTLTTLKRRIKDKYSRDTDWLITARRTEDPPDTQQAHRHLSLHLLPIRDFV